MDCKRLPGLILGLCLLSTSLVAQVSDYDWARGLTREFGFDDMAEKVFNDLASGSGRTPLEKQQGQLGLAEMKQVQARSAKDIQSKLDLFEAARKLMQGAVKSWPEKGTNEYYSAIFSLVDLLQERGEAAMEAVNDQAGLDEQLKDSIMKGAENDFGRAQTELERVKSAMGEPDPDADRQKWRVRNGAWYRLCLLKYNKALTGKEKSSKRIIQLNEAAEMLEEYILENETEDEEAFLGALYGYLLMGQVRAKLEEADEAIGNFSSVIDQIVWEDPENPSYRLHPLVQSLSERAYYLLLNYLNEEKRFEDTMKYGTEMETRFKKMGLEPKKLGRAARVEVAEARLRLGDMNGALGIAAEVVENAGGDASGILANQLVAEIIAATPDKSQFAPDIIRSAAKGAYSQGGEKRKDAIRYFKILLQVLPKIEDEDTRAYFEADAWYYMGRAYYFMGRKLEAAMVLAEGSRRCKAVSRDDLNQELPNLWRRSLRDVLEDTGSPEVRKLLNECETWLVANRVGDVAPGTILYNQARQIERRANALKGPAAITQYGKAADKYAESVAAGGPKKEQAMIKQAKTGLTVAELQFKEKQAAAARSRAQTAKRAFIDYLKYADDPGNKLTDPKELSGREAARAEARYSIARTNRLLMKIDAGNEALEKRLWKETLPYLVGFENKYRSQKGLCVAVVSDRIRARLAAGDIVGAENDYQVLKSLDPKNPRTGYAAYLVGSQLRGPAREKYEKIIGKATPTSPTAWAAVKAKPGFEAARLEMKKVYEYYREWLLAGSGQSNFKYWDLVLWMWGRIDEPAATADLHRKALARFEGMSSADPKKILIWKNRLLHADVRLAKAADLAGNADEAGRLWNEAGQMVEAVMQDSRFKKNPVSVRLAAEVYGGYITTKAGLKTYYPCLGRFDKALAMWKAIERSLRANGKSGTDPWWEAKFYIYYAAYKQDRASGQDLSRLKKAMDSFKSAFPNYGGDVWQPYFDWLYGKLF